MSYEQRLKDLEKKIKRHEKLINSSSETISGISNALLLAVTLCALFSGSLVLINLGLV